MLAKVRIFVFAFVAGVIVGLAIRNATNRDATTESPRVATRVDPGAIPAPSRSPSASAPVERGIPVRPDSDAVTMSTDSAIGPAGPATAMERMAAQQPPLPAAPLSDDLEARSKPLTGLLDASSLRCDIDVAHGANWSQGKATLHAINYQGGPFSLDSIDLEAATAMMSGGSGVTGSLTGELEMRTTAGDKGLTFSAFTRYGDLLIVTVYPALDARGRYRTVMTTFGDRFDHETAQFFGACEVSLARR